MEDVLKKFIKKELITILTVLGENKSTYNRIKTIVQKMIEM